MAEDPLIDLPLDRIVERDGRRLVANRGSRPAAAGVVEGRARIVRDKVFGSALELRGAGDRIRVEPLQPAPTKFTVELWVRPDRQFRGRASVLWSGGIEQLTCSLVAGSNIAVEWTGPTHGRFVCAPTSPVQLPPDRWTPLAFTVDTSTDEILLYLGGRLIAPARELTTYRSYPGRMGDPPPEPVRQPLLIGGAAPSPRGYELWPDTPEWIGSQLFANSTRVASLDGVQVREFKSEQVLAVSPDEQFVATADYTIRSNSTIQLRNLRSERPRPDENQLGTHDDGGVPRWKRDASGILYGVFSPDGRFLALTSSTSESVSLVDTRTGDPTPGASGEPVELRHSEEELTTQSAGGFSNNGMGKALFSPDGETILTTRGCTARTWDLEGRARHVLWQAPRGSSEEVWAAVFSPDSSRIVTIGRNGLANLWKSEDGSHQAKFDLHADVLQAAFSPDGRTLALLLEDSTVFFDPETRKRLFDLPAGSVPFGPVLTPFSADGRRFVGVDRAEGKVLVFDLEDRRQLFDLPGRFGQSFDQNARRAGFNLDGTHIVCFGSEWVRTYYFPQPFMGRLAKVRVTDDILPRSEIRSRAEAELPERTEPPLVDLSLDGLVRGGEILPNLSPRVPATDGLVTKGQPAIVADELFGRALEIHGTVASDSSGYYQDSDDADKPEPDAICVKGLDLASRKITIEAWVRPGAESLSGDLRLLALKPSQFSSPTVYLCAGSSLSIRDRPRSSSRDCAPTPPVKLRPEEWAHVALTGDDSEIRLYLDGRLLATKNDWSFGWGEEEAILEIGETTSPTETKHRIAHVRVYDRVVADSEEEMRRHIEEQLFTTAPGSHFPLEFSLHDALGQPVLAHSAPVKPMELRIRNTGRKNVVLPHGPDTGQLELSFLPDTLQRPEGVIVGPPFQIAGSKTDDSGTWVLSHREEPEGSDVFSLSLELDKGNAAASILLPGETLRLGIAGLRPDPETGTHSTRVEMRYRLRYQDGEPVEGSRLHYLSALEMTESEIQSHVADLGERAARLAKRVEDQATWLTGELAGLERQADTVLQQERKMVLDEGAPLTAAIHGPTSILCDGHSLNSLTIRITNHGENPVGLVAGTDTPGTGSEIFLDIGKGAGHPWALGTRQELEEMKLQLPSEGRWKQQPTASGFRIWTTAGNEQIRDSLELTLANFRCSAPPGRALIYLRYKNIGHAASAAPGEERPSGHFVFRVDRSPIAPQPDLRGAGQTGKSHTVVDGRLDLVNAPVLGFREANWLAVVGDNETSVADEPDAKIQLSGGTLSLSSQKALALTGSKVQIANLHLTGTVHGDKKALTGLAHVGAGQITAHRGVTYDQGPASPKRNDLVPKGIIIMWSGFEKDIPEGWLPCDGRRLPDGTRAPNLVDRFIVAQGTPEGWNDSYAVNQQGSSDQHTHYLDLPALSLQTDPAGAHDHLMPSAWYARGVSCGKHWAIDVKSTNPTLTRVKGVPNHSHSGWTSAKTIRSDLSEDLNRPHWFALCFLIKT